MAAYRVLSLDGGGVRGLLTTVLLQRVLLQAGLLRAFDRGNLDLIAGNSSGALIALGMAHGLEQPMMVRTLGVTRAAFENPELVFGKSSWWNTVRWVFAPKYGREARATRLKELLGEKTTLGDFHHRVLITTIDLDGNKRQAGRDWKPKIFHNFEGKGSDRDEEAWSVAMYSTAAITYFPIEKGFADGGVYANNPSMCALAQVFDRRYQGETRKLEDVFLLSVGSGQNLSFVPASGKKWGLLNWAWNGRFVHLQTDATEGIAHYQCRQMLPPENYFRLAPVLPSGRYIKIDAFNDVDFLERLVDQPAVAEQIATCAQWMRKYWMPGLPPSTPVQPERTSLHVRTATELTCRMPIKAGFLDTVETTTYMTRLGFVLKTLQVLRTASRELHTIRPIVDIVDAAKTVYGFSWEIDDQHQELVLTVHFDRPWEPYIRVVWKDLGPLLDLILCSCEGYVPSALGHDAFVRYVRNHQRDTGFFYPASSVSVADQNLLEQLEKLQRDGVRNSLEEFDRAAATLTAQSTQALAKKDREKHASDAREQWLAVLDALYALRRFFPAHTDDERLLRQSVRALLDWKPDDNELPKTPQVEWYRNSKPRELPDAEARRMDWDSVQGGIADPYARISHGCMVLARIDDPEKAREFVEWLALQVTSGRETRRVEGATRDAIDGFNVAFTFSGLERLEVREESLGQFPKEFREGMEARAGLLGDVHTNHPDNWNLPERNIHCGAIDGDGVPSRVQMSTVDLVIILQAAVTRDDKYKLTPDHPLYDRVRELCRRAWAHGVDVLSVEPMRRLAYDEKLSRDHFGFADGMSQPQAVEVPRQRDEVELGELFVGFRNQRHDPPFPKHCDEPGQCDQSSLIDSGSFLVIRKLREHVDQFNETVKRAAQSADMSTSDILQHMVGRDKAGDPLVDPKPTDKKRNDFDYAGDPNGMRCPFHAHIRRGNPRPAANGVVPRRAIPRIARRSLAFGPNHVEGDHEHRGIIFMAYNASIAEQFEMIQRWMSGGNTPTSSGGTAVFGGQRDPLLGLPDADGKRTFRFRLGNDVKRIDLGPDPFVTLDWGLYLFVPSIPTLKKLACPPERDDQPDQEAVQRGAATMQLLLVADQWAALLEDLGFNRSGATRDVFAAISAQHRGTLRTPYGVLVTSKDLAMEVLTNDADFSVSEYQNRFKQSVGKNYLGLDRGDEYCKESRLPNSILEAFPEEKAFDAARRVMLDELNKAVDDELSKPIHAGARRLVAVPLQPVIDTVVAHLATRWFDLPDDKFMKIGGEDAKPDRARCPFDFLAPSRYVFSSPNPRPKVEELGRDHGQSILRAAEKFVSSGRPLVGDIAVQLQREIPDHRQLAHLLLGLMFGFVPTVYGNTLQVLEHWLEDRSLWRVQQRVRASGANRYVVASTILRADMERTLLADPLPLLLHRTAKVERRLGSVTVSPNDRIVLCMSGIAAESLATDEPDVTLIFGGDRFDKSREHPLHACPGRQIATGAMLGILMALLEYELVPSRALLTVQLDPGISRGIGRVGQLEYSNQSGGDPVVPGHP